MAEMKDYYAQLGVGPDASLDLIKSSYRKKAALYHPDRNPDKDAAQKFRAIQEAYELLSDPQRRESYDDSRRRSLIDDPLDSANQIWSSIIDRVK